MTRPITLARRCRPHATRQAEASPGMAGFTLIELMAVVAVIAILALIALPSFQQRVIRSQISDALSLADIAKAPVATAWKTSKSMPADNAAAGLPVPDKIVSNYVSSLTLEAGAIHLKFGNRANATIKDKTLTLRPAVVEDEPIVPIAWVCGQAQPPDKMTAHGTNRTDIPAGLLPLACR